MKDIEYMTKSDFLNSQFTDLLFDIECYRNYFLVMYYHPNLEKFFYIEMKEDSELNTDMIRWLINHYRLVGFNNISYDLPMLYYALKNKDNITNEKLKEFSDWLISSHNLYPVEIYKTLGIDFYKHKFNTIDLMKIAPKSSEFRVGLKLYGARLNSKNIQELPIDPSENLTYSQMSEIFKYCINDIDCTRLIYDHVYNLIDMRSNLEKLFSKDFNFSTEPVIAETVIRDQLRIKYNKFISKSEINVDNEFKYNIIDELKFNSSHLNELLNILNSQSFILNENKKIVSPKDYMDYKVGINKGLYSVGKGGIHSNEKNTSVYSSDTHQLIDIDVTSYYPFIILNQGLYPKACGPKFLNIYQNLVDERLRYKKLKYDDIATSLKIVINGIFGKFGSNFSILFNPQGLIQVTLTGQLSILMLIEMFEENDIQVMSANTDGIVIFPAKNKLKLTKQIISKWESIFKFKLEPNLYKSLHSRDVNSYIAIKNDGSVKFKGNYTDPDKVIMEKNASNPIISKAIINYLKYAIPIEHTIKYSNDITKFLSIAYSKDPCIFDNKEIGKVIRFYHAKNFNGAIYKKQSMHLLPDSLNCKPLMNLKNVSDIDYNWYIKQTRLELEQLGVIKNLNKLF